MTREQARRLASLLADQMDESEHLINRVKREYDTPAFEQVRAGIQTVRETLADAIRELEEGS